MPCDPKEDKITKINRNMLAIFHNLMLLGYALQKQTYNEKYLPFNIYFYILHSSSGSNDQRKHTIPYVILL